jgi:phosphatidylglycerol lysyltransferase
MMARNLLRHSHYAFRLARWLLPIGAILLLIKGLNIELAIFQLLVWIMLLPSSVYFTRRRSLLRAPYGVAWIVAISAVVLTTVFLAYFAFRQIPTFNAPWLEIASQNESSRALRSLLSVPLALALFGVARLLRPRRAVFALERDPAAIRAIAEQSDRALTQLAFLGDKRFLLSPNRRAFLMYTAQDRSLIALGDPVGDASEFEELLWQFRELADKRNMRPVVYHARPENFQIYFDIGLIPHSLGEEAVLELAKFSKQRADLHDLNAKVEQAKQGGFSVEVIDPAALLEYLPQLEQISAQWLSEHQTNERAFAVGHFDSRFIAQFPHALFRVNGELKGFATVLPSAKAKDVRVDMIRHRGEMPVGWMEALFVQLIEWAQQHGHSQLKLGLVPLNDWTNHPLAALWHRIGRSLFLHNRAVETPEDVRSFKNQFAPRWETRYLMSPAEVELYPILSDVGAVMLREKNSRE